MTPPSGLELLGMIGTGVFAASGALVASRRQMDLIGFGLMATLTGIGGGTLRDLVLDRPVFWVADQSQLVVCLAVALVVFFWAPMLNRRYTVLLWADAAGLSAFAVLGAQIAWADGAGALVAITLGMATACFGGLARDIAAGESPLLLKPELYATAALAAAGTFIALRIGEVPRLPAVLLGIAAGLALRAGAILRGWALPRYRPRPPREP